MYRMETSMTLLETLKKIEHFILGDNKHKSDNKPPDHWKKYRRQKTDS